MINSFNSFLIKVKTMIDHFVSDFNNSFKVLYLVSELNMRSPKEICSTLNMAKSNLAIIAAELKQNNYLQQYKAENNNKEIVYEITELGRSKLNDKIKTININDTDKEDFISKITNFLTK